MGIFARVQFLLPAHYLVTWEEEFYTGFFEYQSNIFGPLVQDLGARYVAYQALEMQNPLEHILESRERQQCMERWEEGLRQIQHQHQMDKARFRQRQ